MLASQSAFPPMQTHGVGFGFAVRGRSGLWDVLGRKYRNERGWRGVHRGMLPQGDVGISRVDSRMYDEAFNEIR